MALHKAVVLRHTPIAQLLLQQDADPYAINRDGQKFLHIAAKYGLPDLIRGLLVYAHDVQAKDRMGYTSFQHAVEDNAVEIAETLLN